MENKIPTQSALEKIKNDKVLLKDAIITNLLLFLTSSIGLLVSVNFLSDALFDEIVLTNVILGSFVILLSFIAFMRSVLSLSTLLVTLFKLNK